LGAQLAERALADGGGIAATLVLARANSMRRCFEEAEAALAAIEHLMPGHASAVDYLEQRIRVLYWGLGRVDETRALLDRAREWSQARTWQHQLVPLRMPVAAADDLAGTTAAVQAVLAEPELDAATRRLLEVRYALLLFYGGRWGQAHEVARRHRPAIPIRDYSALIAMGAYRIAAIESGADWPDLEAHLAKSLREGVRCNDHEAAAQAAVGQHTSEGADATPSRLKAMRDGAWTREEPARARLGEDAALARNLEAAQVRGDSPPAHRPSREWCPSCLREHVRVA
jgi:hypothetical protein